MKFESAAAGLVAALLGSSALVPCALAQSAPGFTYGQVPTAAQWNSYFAAKVDTTGGTLTNGTVTTSTITNSTLSGITTIAQPGTISTPNTVFSGQTSLPAPLVNMNFGNLSGTLGNGGTIKTPTFVMWNFNVASDTIHLNNAANPRLLGGTYRFGPGTGARGLGNISLHQQGPMAPDGTRQPQYGGGSFPAWVTMTDTSGGTSVSSTYGLVYGSNPQVALTDGAIYYGLANGGGEVDLNVHPTRETLVLTGSIGGGGTVCIGVASTGTVFSTGSVVNENLCYPTAVTDTVQTVVNGLAALILHDNTLVQSNIGQGVGGASQGTVWNTLDVMWPQIDTITITPSITGEAGLTITPSTVTIGASVQQRTWYTFVEQGGDGSPGFTSDSFIIVGRQAPNFMATSGQVHALVQIGGQVTVEDQSGNSYPRAQSMWPFWPYADLIWGPEPTQYGGAQDAPQPAVRLHSVLNLGNIDFCESQGGAIMIPGFETFCNGALRIGSGGISRLVNNAATAGIGLSASGWEGTAMTIISGGGAGTINPYLGRYMVGDSIKCGQVVTGGTTSENGWGFHGQVDSVNSSGAITAFHVLGDGAGNTAWPSSLSVSSPSGTCTVMGGSGTGATLAVTWTAANTVRVGASADTVALVGTVAINGTLGVSCSGSPTAGFVSVNGVVTHC